MTDIVTIGDATLYCGDCLEILPTLDKVDAVVTDPPYGIGFSYESHDDNEDSWFQLMDSLVPVCIEKSTFFVMPICRIDRAAWWYANHPPDWLISWHKGSPGQRSHVGFSAWEPHLCWGKPKKQMHDAFSSRTGFDDNRHPCPKPLIWAEWLSKRAAEHGGTIMDPFMGSGTTGVACANMGRKFIGIEIERKYFDIACERIEAAYAQGRLFT